jgi:hypothetical protein
LCRRLETRSTKLNESAVIKEKDEGMEKLLEGKENAFSSSTQDYERPSSGDKQRPSMASILQLAEPLILNVYFELNN